MSGNHRQPMFHGPSKPRKPRRFRLRLRLPIPPVHVRVRWLELLLGALVALLCVDVASGIHAPATTKYVPYPVYVTDAAISQPSPSPDRSNMQRKGRPSINLPVCSPGNTSTEGLCK